MPRDGFFDRDKGIDAVQVEQVDDVGAQMLEGSFGRLPGRLGAAVEASCVAVVVELGGGLRGGHESLSSIAERAADELFVLKWSVRLGGID
jgi:hypothetical protein